MKKRVLYIFLGLMLFAKVGMGQQLQLRTGSYSTSSSPINYNCGQVRFQINVPVGTNYTHYNLKILRPNNTVEYYFANPQEINFPTEYANITFSNSPSWSGIYTVEFTPANSGISPTNVSLNNYGSNQIEVEIRSLPVVSISEVDASGSSSDDKKICEGGSTTLSVSGASTYVWGTGETSTSITKTPVTTTTYTVTGTDVNGCENSDIETVTVNPIPTLTVTNPIPVCYPNTIDLSTVASTSAGASISFWHDVNTTLTVPSTSVFNSNTYYIKAADANGCVNIQPVNVVVHPKPILTVNPSSLQVCLGESLQLSASGAPSLTWDNGVVNGAIFYPTSTNTYTVVGMDANGCSNVATVTIPVNPIPEVGIVASPVNTVFEGKTINVLGSVTGGTAPFTYVWTSSDPTKASISGGGTALLDAFKMGTVTISYKIIDINGCSSEESLPVTITILPSIISFDAPNAFTPNGDGLNDYFKVVYNHYISSLKSFVIFNKNGRVVFPVGNEPIELGWDGRVKGVMQEADTYMWKAVLITNGVEEVKMGTMALIK